MCMLHIMLAVAQWFYKRGNPLPFNTPDVSMNQSALGICFLFINTSASVTVCGRRQGLQPVAPSELLNRLQTRLYTLVCVVHVCFSALTVEKLRRGVTSSSAAWPHPTRRTWRRNRIETRVMFSVHILLLVSQCVFSPDFLALMKIFSLARLFFFFSSNSWKGEPCTDGTTVVHLRRASQWWISTKKQVLKDSGKAQISLHVLV